MPYIEQKNRAEYKTTLDILFGKWCENGCHTGHLVYIVYILMMSCWKRNKRFTTGALLIGGLVCAILEFYRRAVSNYEDAKINLEGDIE